MSCIKKCDMYMVLFCGIHLVLCHVFGLVSCHAFCPVVCHIFGPVSYHRGCHVNLFIFNMDSVMYRMPCHIVDAMSYSGCHVM